MKVRCNESQHIFLTLHKLYIKCCEGRADDIKSSPHVEIIHHDVSLYEPVFSEKAYNTLINVRLEGVNICHTDRP